MKPPILAGCSLLILALCGVPGSALHGQTTSPPIVKVAPKDITVPVNSAPTVISIKKVFGLQDVNGKLVRFATSEGDIDVELLTSAAPASVANFLSYANAGNYNNSLIHRSVPGFVIQGGGYAVANNQVTAIAQNAPVVGEHSVSNTRGTLAIALSTGPDSGTNQWFFNLADNSSMLDGTSDGGPFTVFGRVTTTQGLAVMDAIAALQVVDASGGNSNSPFGALPVLPTYNGSSVALTDLVYVESVTYLPLTPAVQGGPAALKLKTATSNPDLVVPTISASKLTLTYAPGQTGMAQVSIVAKNADKIKVRTDFFVTVQ